MRQERLARSRVEAAGRHKDAYAAYFGARFLGQIRPDSDADPSEQQTEICGKIATAAGVETDAVTCEFEDHGEDDDHSGHAHGRRLQADEGVVVTADIVVPDGKTLQSIGNSLNSAMGTTAKASALLGVTVTSAPTMTANDGSGAVEPSPSGLSTGAIIGIAVGAVCAVILVLAAVYVMKKKKGPATNAKGANV